MYIFINALKNLLRNKGRNILLGLMIFVIIGTSTVALAINYTSDVVINDYKDRFGSQVVISPDTEKMMAQREEMMEESASEGDDEGTRRFRMTIPEVTADQALLFAESEYLKDSAITATISVGDSSISPISSTETVEDVNGQEEVVGEGMNFEIMQEDAEGGKRIMTWGQGGSEIDTSDPNYVETNFRLIGGDYTAFDDDTRTLVEGAFPAEGSTSEIIISQDLADYNALTVGSVLTLSANLSTTTTSTLEDGTETNVTTLRKAEFPMTVVGIYADFTEENSGGFGMPDSMNSRNELLTTTEAVTTLQQPGETGVSVDATYYLNDPADLEAFKAEVESKGLDENLTVTTNDAQYEALVSPVQNISNITLTFLIAILILGVLVILLLSNLAIRERKYEIGVLRAMGMKKSKVSLGLISENVVLTLAFAVVGIFGGYLVSQPIANSLLASQQSASTIESSAGGPETIAGGPAAGGGMPGGGSQMIQMGNMSFGSSSIEQIKDISVAIGVNTILELLAIALVIALVASLSGILRITRYEPIRILSHRN